MAWQAMLDGKYIGRYDEGLEVTGVMRRSTTEAAEESSSIGGIMSFEDEAKIAERMNSPKWEIEELETVHQIREKIKNEEEVPAEIVRLLESIDKVDEDQIFNGIPDKRLHAWLREHVPTIEAFQVHLADGTVIEVTWSEDGHDAATIMYPTENGERLLISDIMTRSGSKIGTDPCLLK